MQLVKQQPSNQGDNESSVMRKIGRVHYVRGTAFDFISVPQYITCLGCILNGAPVQMNCI
jgi:hypothetical protein